ncbi:uncharacterized protein PGTG_07891 [Puccinia graminis f. sp. tritici CRL 75-36-700-3]|uniref:Uncharacterized protein n=1 Tax=Puccinia graminis f. sp. tritici (strain CRL 75-36-700-3 / race SCCL) TaxID=418459 RepID=E3KBC9_PUCGT|nr:uncharacterized protein PGTG_07891 [Puccinia graminis f. sp. tritici CRL 75-36-700-3]EFP81642.1 hypothetical protein PGTG_07891 [Puccinia graminis f. sp. tritici CRL 75-36-700-3]
MACVCSRGKHESSHMIIRRNHDNKKKWAKKILQVHTTHLGFSNFAAWPAGGCTLEVMSSLYLLAKDTFSQFQLPAFNQFNQNRHNLFERTVAERAEFKADVQLSKKDCKANLFPDR